MIWGSVEYFCTPRNSDKFFGRKRWHSPMVLPTIIQKNIHQGSDLLIKILWPFCSLLPSPIHVALKINTLPWLHMSIVFAFRLDMFVLLSHFWAPNPYHSLIKCFVVFSSHTTSTNTLELILTWMLWLSLSLFLCFLLLWWTWNDHVRKFLFWFGVFRTIDRGKSISACSCINGPG